MQDKQYAVYMLSNKVNTVLYTGVSSNLVKRVYEHKSKAADGFTARYKVDKLVYYEMYQDPKTAIAREKTIKNMVRRKKDKLVENINHEWKDLYEDIV